MGKLRLGVCGAVALVATYGLFNVVTAHAATISHSFTLSVTAPSTAAVYSTSAFNEFNPALGTLVGISVALSGNVEFNLGFNNSYPPPPFPGWQVDLVFHGTAETIGGQNLGTRACIQLRRIVTAANCTPARKFLASLS
jgi:hypothetical protein